MNLKEVIYAHLIPLAARSHKAASRQLEEMNERGLLRSTMTVTGNIGSFSEQFNDEIKQLFSKLANVKFTLGELKEIKSRFLTFVESQYDERVKDLSTKRLYHESGELWVYEFDKIKDSKLNETKAIVELELTIQRQLTIRRYRAFCWDASKILISAVVGGIIGGFLKDYLG